MNKAVFITVRTGSSRLPLKCLKLINKKRSIEYVIDNAKKSIADKVILCTTELPEDDILADIAHSKEILCFRGSEEDKLMRWLGAVDKYSIDFFVTADGDDLFCAPELIDKAFDQFIKSKADFIEEKPGENVPVGAFTYGIKADALRKVCELKDTFETEMMSVYFTETNLFKVEKLLDIESCYRFPEIRMTLDYQEDLDFFMAVVEGCSSLEQKLNLKNIINYCNEHPEVVELNKFRNIDYLNNQKAKTHLDIKQI